MTTPWAPEQPCTLCTSRPRQLLRGCVWSPGPRAVGSAQRPADPYSDTRTEAPRRVGGGHGRSSRVSGNQAETTAKRKTTQQMLLGPPPLLRAALWVQSSCHSPQLLHSDLLLSSRPPAWLPPLETWDTSRLPDCAFLMHLVNLRVTKPGLWWKSGKDPQPSLGSWHLRGCYSQRVCSLVRLFLLESSIKLGHDCRFSERRTRYFCSEIL